MGVIFSLDIKNVRKALPSEDSSYQNGFYLEGGNGPVVILIHGLTGTPSEMKSLANSLQRSGYSVICPRLADHGKPIRVLKNTKWQDFYESVRKVMSDERVANAAGPIFVGGLSMGALLALLLAEEFKERIAAVTCLAPTLFYDGWNTPHSKYFLPLAATPIGNFFYFKEEPPYGIKNEVIQERIHKYYSNAKLDDSKGVEQYGYPFFPATLLHQLKILVKYLAKRLPAIICPVQLIQAKDDDVASVKNSKFIYDRIGSEIKEMVLLYNSYHVITADHERDIVAAKVEDFFNKVREKMIL